MEPLLFFADLVEETVNQGQKLRVLLRVLDNPANSAPAFDYSVSFKASLSDGSLVEITPISLPKPAPKLTTGTYTYYFDIDSTKQEWSVGAHLVQVDVTREVLVPDPDPTMPPKLVVISADTTSLALLVLPPVVQPTQIVTMQPFKPSDTKDEDLWAAIKIYRLEFLGLFEYVKEVLCEPGIIGPNSSLSNRLPFVQTSEYSVLKFAVEAYMMEFASPDAANSLLTNYLVPNPNLDGTRVLPYFDVVLRKLTEYQYKKADIDKKSCLQRLVARAQGFSPFELIWSFWMEEAMLVQTLNGISLRFQNIKGMPGLETLYRLDTSHLLPLSNLLWGYIQDEQHSLSLHRRTYEYDHAYGLTLQGKAVPNVKAMDTRSKFLEAYHNLLHRCAIYYREADDATRRPDALPVLNALLELHLLLAQGFHNAYHNLTWTARHEMIVQQVLLAQPEMREFLGGRIMVPYVEPWMDKVDTMRGMMGWGDTGIRHFWDLATFGELILLSVRYGNWSSVIDPDQAANWASAFRDEVMRYIHSYRAVAGVDLSADTVGLKPEHFVQPSVLIQRRLASRLNSSGAFGTMRRRAAAGEA